MKTSSAIFFHKITTTANAHHMDPLTKTLMIALQVVRASLSFLKFKRMYGKLLPSPTPLPHVSSLPPSSYDHLISKKCE